MALSHQILAVAAVSLTTSANASPAEDVVDQVLGAYLETCATAFVDTDAYLEDLQVPGPSGERVISRTPDGLLTWVVTSHDDLLEDVRFADLPTGSHVNCVFTKTMTTPITTGHDLGAAFIAFMENLPEAAIVGGEAPQDQPLVVFGGGDGIAPIGDSHIYVASGLFPELKVITYIETHTTYFAVSGVLSLEAD